MYRQWEALHLQDMTRLADGQTIQSNRNATFYL